MTDSNYTALLIVLDRSGSMSSIRDEMVGGLETMLDEHAKEPGLLTVDIVTFDNMIEHTHSFANPKDVKVVLEPRGGTALFDALGFAINTFGTSLAALPEHARPGTVQVIVVTDGEENSSQEYSAQAVKKLVTQQTDQYDWEFVFLGANQDAALAARHIGIDADKALMFDADPDAVGRLSSVMSEKLKRTRRGDRSAFTAEERKMSRRDDDSKPGESGN